MDNKFRIALVGCGALARIFYLPVFKHLSIVPTIVDPNTNGISDLLGNYKIEAVSSSLETVIDRIDGAIIASPNFLHFPQAKYLLENGKSILLEKPIASTQQQVKDLIRISEASHVVFQPGMMRRFWKINRAVKKLVQDGVLGPLRSVSMQEGSILNWPANSTSIFSQQQSLGGVFIDTGSHTLDLLNWWVDDENFELQYLDDNKGGVEADCHLEVHFKTSGVRAEVSLSRIRSMSNEFLISGTNGWIKLKPWLNVFETSAKRIDKYIYEQFKPVELKQQGFQDLFIEQVDAWRNACLQNSEPFVQAESVMRSIRMLEESYKQRKELVYSWN